MKRSEFNLWMEALRSGKFHKGKHKLHSVNNEYCCLGVFCEVMNIPKVNVSETLADHYYGITNDNSSYYLPRYVAEKYGFKAINGQVDPADTTIDWLHQSLPSINDHVELTFPQIADYLEQHGHKYFTIEEDLIDEKV